MMTLKVTVWNEYRHEKSHEEVRNVYPDGIHAPIAEHLQRSEGMTVRAATLDEPEHGLTEAVLAETDVLTWWGHMAHHEVSDEIVKRVQKRVLDGMGLIVLHSGHLSKIFRSLLGTYFEIPHEEMYGERFDIPAPDTLVFISWFQGGEVFRSGCCYQRGLGKIFYFRPGHETYPTYYQKEVLQVIANAVKWAAPSGAPSVTFGNRPPLEKL